MNHAPKGDIYMIPQKQLTLADIFENCKEIFDSDKPQFLTLLENHIDLDEMQASIYCFLNKQSCSLYTIIH